MYHPTCSSSLTPPSGTLSRLAVFRRVFLLVWPAAIWLLPLYAVYAVSPPPDGGYPNANTAEGTNAFFHLATGAGNTATGYFALYSLTTGNNNTATGGLALFANTTGGNNTANGVDALLDNTSGNENTANGYSALYSNSTGSFNVANGVNALHENTTGTYNTANGFEALFSNTTGNDNIANGVNALHENTTGSNNVGSGAGVLTFNTTGHDNTAEGYLALANNKTGSNNIALGSNAGINLTTGSNNIDIGTPGVAAEANTIRIGKSATQKKAFIAGIRGVTVASGVGVIVGTTGQLGTVVSSARFKEAIKPIDKASEAILALKPVTFRYKEELDPDKIPQFGLVAEEVEKVNPDLVVRDEDGKVMTVRYEAVNAMLLNEFLKEHKKVAKQESTIAELKAALAKQQATNAQQQRQIEALTAGLQKVSAAVELNKPAPTQVADTR